MRGSKKQLALLSRFARRLALAYVFSSAGVATAESLPAAVAKALSRHPDILSNQALSRAAGERIEQARSNFYPSLGLDAAAADSRDRERTLLFGTSESDRNIRRADVYLRWNLFRGFADRHGLRLAVHDHQAAEYELADINGNVAMQVTLAYIEVWRLRERLALARAHLQETQRLGEELNKRVRMGRAPQIELEQGRIALTGAEREAERLQAQLTVAEARYSLLVGQAPEEMQLPELDGGLAKLQLDEALQRLTEGNLRLRAARMRAAARAEEARVAGAGLYPSVNLELRKRIHSDIDPIPQTDTLASRQIQLTYDLPLGGASLSRKREAIARMEAAQAAVDSIQLQTRISLQQIWPAWEDARRATSRLADRAESSAKVVSGYDLQFTAGRRTLQDLIAVRAELTRARGELIDNQAERQTGAAQLLYLLGMLGETLGLSAPPSPG